MNSTEEYIKALQKVVENLEIVVDACEKVGPEKVQILLNTATDIISSINGSRITIKVEC